MVFVVAGFVRIEGRLVILGRVEDLCATPSGGCAVMAVLQILMLLLGGVGTVIHALLLWGETLFADTWGLSS